MSSSAILAWVRQRTSVPTSASQQFYFQSSISQRALPRLSCSSGSSNIAAQLFARLCQNSFFHFSEWSDEASIRPDCVRPESTCVRMMASDRAKWSGQPTCQGFDTVSRSSRHAAVPRSQRIRSSLGTRSVDQAYRQHSRGRALRDVRSQSSRGTVCGRG